MGYPTEIDEISDEKLIAEVRRRYQVHQSSGCTYCGRSILEETCRFPEFHRAQKNSPVDALIETESSEKRAWKRVVILEKRLQAAREAIK